jgi:Ca2+-binding RTX toxin-like protein
MPTLSDPVLFIRAGKMAIITQHLNYAFNINKLDFSDLRSGASYTETSTRFIAHYGNGYKDEFRGTGFTYNASTHELTGGTVHAYSFLTGSTRLVNVEGLNLAGTKIANAARTVSTADDKVVIKTALAGNDTYTGGNLADIFNGFAGNDTLNGREGNDRLAGDTGNDTILGAGGNDVLSGDAGADKVIGGAGIDTIVGGANNDIFVFNAGASAANRDVIQDFTNAAGNNDTFQLENAVMPALGAAGALKSAAFFAGAAAHDADDRIIYNRSTGNVFYDSNGNLAGGSVIIATLTTKPLLTAADFQVI